MYKLYLIRHGMTAGNEEKRYIGRTDESLSEKGRSQILSLKESSQISEPSVIGISPMKRCRESAELLFPGKKYISVPDFREYDFGKFEGKTYKELLGEPTYQKWLDGGGRDPFPEGEGMAVFKKRTIRAFLDFMTQCTKDFPDGAVCALVVHGGTIMSLMEHFAGRDGSYYDYQIPNGSFVEAFWDESSCRISMSTL